jgi:uncharacterized protein (UPF0335 family)
MAKPSLTERIASKAVDDRYNNIGTYIATISLMEQQIIAAGKDISEVIAKAREKGYDATNTIILYIPNPEVPFI